MKLILTAKTLEQIDSNLIVIPHREGGKNRPYAFLNKKAKKALQEVAEAEGFKGQRDRTLIWQGEMFDRNVKIMLVGTGPEKDPFEFRTAVGRGVRYAYAHKIEKMALFVDSRDFGPKEAVVAMSAEGVVMSDYRFTTYKSGAKRVTHPKEVLMGLYPASEENGVPTKAFRMGKARASSVVLARDLVNEPANMLSPEELADRAKTLAKQKGLDIQVFDETTIRQKRMSLLLSVAAGSVRPPRFIHLIYRPKGKPSRRVVLVGKGVMFDSGGLCIKPGKSMYEMKTDMAGGAAVIGVMSALKALDITAEVHGIVPATDNTIDGNATRPGDVFTSVIGKTVEVVNTDAEGRLILADALAYATALKPDIMIDLATLTGACEVALGSFTAGLFAKHDKDAAELLKAAETAGERLWRLPLARELESSIRSDVADIKNIGARFGGAITAALFLKQFTKDVPWAHLDIAGPARLDKATPLCSKGGTGYGVLTALAYLESLTV
jgi:leucyl aminopeptidase